jgi:hypothetical protein
VAGNARRLGGERHDKRRGADASDYPEDNNHNNDAKPTPEEAEESGPIYPCTALAVFKILESFCSSLSAGEGVLPLPTPAVVGAVDGGRRGLGCMLLLVLLLRLDLDHHSNLRITCNTAYY